MRQLRISFVHSWQPQAFFEKICISRNPSDLKNVLRKNQKHLCTDLNYLKNPKWYACILYFYTFTGNETRRDHRFSPPLALAKDHAPLQRRSEQIRRFDERGLHPAEYRQGRNPQYEARSQNGNGIAKSHPHTKNHGRKRAYLPHLI